jgi:hypothetical protein
MRATSGCRDTRVANGSRLRRLAHVALARSGDERNPRCESRWRCTRGLPHPGSGPREPTLSSPGGCLSRLHRYQRAGSTKAATALGRLNSAKAPRYSAPRQPWVTPTWLPVCRPSAEIGSTTRRRAPLRIWPTAPRASGGWPISPRNRRSRRPQERSCAPFHAVTLVPTWEAGRHVYPQGWGAGRVAPCRA